VLGRGTSQEVADHRENAFRALIARFFPAPYQIAKGQVLGVDGARSSSIDCVVLNPAHPHLVDAQGKFTLILADGVDFVVDIKGRLDGAELSRLLAQCRSVKQVVRSQTSLVFPQRSSGLGEASLRIAFYAYCQESVLTPETLAGHIRQWVRENEVSPLERPDAIAVHDQGIYTDLSSPASVAYRRVTGTADDATLAAVGNSQFWLETGDLTLGAMLVMMSDTVPAVASLQAPILQRYGRGLQATGRVVGTYDHTDP
jgi:hypothetical protein